MKFKLKENSMLLKISIYSLFVILLFNSNMDIENASNEENTIEIIAANCGCDFGVSLCFENINDLKSMKSCSETRTFKGSQYYDSLIHILESDKLIEDTVSKKAYGFNLLVYVKLSSKVGVHHEFGIDHQGTIFYNNRSYLPSKELSQLICTCNSTYNNCSCKKNKI